MTDLEKVMKMFSLSSAMGRQIFSFLMLYKKMRSSFLSGVTQAVGYYMRHTELCGGEIARGITEIAEDIKNHRNTALCTDPESFYRKHRALAAIGRTYYYDMSDGFILYQWDAVDEELQYDQAVIKLSSEYYCFWQITAIKRYFSNPNRYNGDADLHQCFRSSFFHTGYLHIWNNLILCSETELGLIRPGGFVFTGGPLTESASDPNSSLMQLLTDANIAYEKRLAAEQLRIAAHGAQNSQ